MANWFWALPKSHPFHPKSPPKITKVPLPYWVQGVHVVHDPFICYFALSLLKFCGDKRKNYPLFHDFVKISLARVRSGSSNSAGSLGRSVP